MKDIVENYHEIKEKIEQAEFVLVGIGSEFCAEKEKKERILQAYEKIENLLQGKSYFIVTENEDTLILESKLLDFFIAAPFAAGECQQNTEEQWNAYLNWLTATLNHKLCILEFGVGFSSPQVIRWPFEKTAEYNLKSFFVRINGKFPQLPKEIAARGISVSCNGIEFLMNSGNE